MDRRVERMSAPGQDEEGRSLLPFEQNGSLYHLLPELLFEILRKLPTADRLSFSLVCRYFNQLARSPDAGTITIHIPAVAHVGVRHGGDTIWRDLETFKPWEPAVGNVIIDVVEFAADVINHSPTERKALYGWLGAILSRLDLVSIHVKFDWETDLRSDSPSHDDFVFSNVATILVHANSRFGYANLSSFELSLSALDTPDRAAELISSFVANHADTLRSLVVRQGYTSLDKIAKLRELTCLELFEIDGYESDPSSVGVPAPTILSLDNHPRLHSLRLSNMSPLDAIRSSSVCSHLQSVILFNCGNLHDVSGLSFCSNLEELALSALACPGLGNVVSTLTSIVKLILHYITSVDFTVFSLKHPHLRTIHIEACDFLVEFGGDFASAPKLENITLQSCSSLTNITGLRYIPSIQTFDILDLPLSTLFPLNHPHLRSISITDCESLTTLWDEGDEVYAPALSKLSIRGCEQLVRCFGLESFGHESIHAPSLSIVELVSCDSLSDISALAGISSIQTLTLYHLPELRNIECFRNHPNLRDVNIDGLDHFDLTVLATCPNITLESLHGAFYSERMSELEQAIRVRDQH